MGASWAHAAPTVLASFLASLVEFVEALTVILAVGTVRGWRSAIGGAAGALLLLLLLVATLGPALARVPLALLQIILGVLLLLFGLRWLRKAILRSAGIIALHDESAAFAKTTLRLQALPARGRGGDAAGFATSFQVTMLEGIEVVFIVVAIGAGRPALLWAASLGALAALAMVASVGAALHRPLARVPENALKFVVGVLLSTFGTFWLGEGLAMPWPGGDWAIPILGLGFLLAAALVVRLARPRPVGGKAA